MPVTDQFHELSRQFVRDTFGIVQCEGCAHRLGPGRCTAFPDGVPGAIVSGQHDHRAPYPGDGGIRYQERLYSTAEAAEYLGMSVSAVKYHVHTMGNLRPRKVGGRLVFTLAQLEAFLDSRRGPGRPKSK